MKTELRALGAPYAAAAKDGLRALRGPHRSCIAVTSSGCFRSPLANRSTTYPKPSATTLPGSRPWPENGQPDVRNLALMFGSLDEAPSVLEVLAEPRS